MTSARCLLALALAALTAAAPTSARPSDTPPAEAAERAPVASADRARLAWLAQSLPDHGLPALTPPKADAGDEAWLTLARRLAQTFAPPGPERNETLAAALARRPLAPAIEALIPSHPRYAALQAHLRNLRRAVMGGQPTLPATPYKVRVGSTAPEVALLRARLALEGLATDTPKGRLAEFFDDRLKHDLWRWQRRNGLPVTVVLDDLTRQRLNAPLDGALARVALALARWRQVALRSEAGRHVLVHLNRFELTAERDGAPELTMSVVIGKATEGDATPTLSSRMTRVVTHPAWTVPNRLVEERLKPLAGGEAEALRGKGFKVELRAGGRWAVSQPAGPDNPLGRLKFPLARTGGIYLHDTPARQDFGKRHRTLSSGCVRLADASALARWLLESPEAIAELDAGLESATSRSVTVPRPADVHLVYQTLGVDDGRLVTYPDIYGLDADALTAIDTKRLLSEPPPAPPAPPVPAPARSTAAAAYGLDLEVTPLSGGPFGLERYRGRMLVVTFTASWCSVCRQLAPELAAFVAAQRARGEDLALLGLTLDEGDPGAITKAMSAHPVPFDVAIPPAGLARGTSALGAIDKLPTTWIVGRTGVPLYRYEGGGVTGAMAEDLARYLAAEKRFASP